MYKDIIKYLVNSYHIKSNTKNLDMKFYEGNDYFFNVQKMINNTGDLQIKNKYFKFAVEEVKEFNKDFKEYKNANGLINDIYKSFVSLGELYFFITSVPHLKLTLSDGILDFSCFKSVYVSDTITSISFKDNIILLYSDNDMKYFINDSNEIFEFIDTVEAECINKNITIKEIGEDITSLVKKMKIENNKIIDLKRSAYIEKEIEKYL